MVSDGFVNCKRCSLLLTTFVLRAGTPEMSTQVHFSVTLPGFMWKLSLHQQWLEPFLCLPEGDHGRFVLGPYWAPVPPPVYHECKAELHYHQCVGDGVFSQIWTSFFPISVRERALSILGLTLSPGKTEEPLEMADSPTVSIRFLLDAYGSCWNSKSNKKMWKDILSQSN